MTHKVWITIGLIAAALTLPASAADTVEITGTVTDRRGNPVPRCDVIFNPTAFIGDDSFYFKCDEQGRYRAEVPAGHYNSLYSLDLPEYAKTQLEFWGWNLTLDQDEVIDIAYDTIEVYSLSVWASNGGSQSLFASFRPMHLASALSPKFYRKQADGQDLAIFDIAPKLNAGALQATVDGQTVRLKNYFWSYEEIGQCGDNAKQNPALRPDEPCYMPMIIAQFERPKLAPGKHQFRLRVQDQNSGEIGEGLTHFVSNAAGLGF
ncbi:carboxypeptidase-like regulatory domain-containing protein [Ferrimonas balearica]|uniref:carboxypeptidase-like regulatory domain-containing protein n=1 Tax=Ferrimonas balearica TaxID=44012 RepID=UPI001F288ABF|nr:carboxypeptidase-like regulatory domain-containing protein [Ferrimonas balearica]MBY6017041.1 carboxypeptidase-like regulatory domain-containing protein [Halomonas denitrificans]MBY6093315.1 carboxypeptidase-like regulatory domain-containing protein [Ferrimonas balearica]